jgi:hypothetical protein
MTAKLLIFYDFARVSAASRTRANEYLRHAAGQPTSRLPADPWHISHLRLRLECRWQIDPVTGALRAHWVRIAADHGSGATAEDVIDDRRCLRPDLAIAGGRDALRLAA